MAPPIPGLRRPVVVRHRTAGDIVAGVAAMIVLAALVIGVPVALVMIVNVPHGLGLSALTGQLDMTSMLGILSIVIWLAWAQLVWCVLVEIKAAVSNVGVASRVPLAGASQSAAHRLVTAAMLLFTAAAALAPVVTPASAPRPAVTASAQVRSGATASGTAAGDPDGAHTASAVRAEAQQMEAQQGAAQQAAQGPNADKVYIVRPPVGRFHESLWEIAENHLGDGRRYREVFELNKDRVQPDGSKLTIASLIRPGWILLMPKDATGPGIQAVTPKLADELGLASHPDSAPQTSGPVVAHMAHAAPTAQDPAWPHELAAASLLAAGVLTALGRKRREQLWRRAFGRRVAGADPDAARAEQALLLGADEAAVRLLDAGLRQLSDQLAAVGKAPPTVFAAHLGHDHLDLWIAPPDPNPPQPWQAADGGQVWRLPSGDALEPDGPGSGARLGAGAGLGAAALAPYPGLVTLGTNPAGRVLVDLEVAHGLIAMRGPRPVVQAALAALAVELVTNRWSDRMQVTLVGFGDGLADIAPDRVRITRTLDEAIGELERRAAEVTEAMEAAGLDSVLTGRSRLADPDLWAPHYLLMGVPPTQAQAERLLALARSKYRTAAGYVIAGDVRGATWTWDLTADGRMRASELGFDLEAQLLPPEQYAAVVRLFRAAAAEPDAPLTALGAGAAPPSHLAPDATMPVEVGLLGPVTVQAPGPLEPERRDQATELVVYLAAHLAGVHPNVLAGALWPRGVTTEVRDAALARAAAWLGTDATGRPNLVTSPDGRLGLGPGARVDWQVFRALFTLGSEAAVAGDVEAEAGYLDRALALVRGQLLDGREQDRYVWLAADDLEHEVTAAVADAAHRLSGLRLAAGEPDAAMAAARAGLKLAFNDEMLWRDLLLGAHATGQEHVLRSVVGELSARTGLDEVMPRMAPETEALIDELLPTWRTSAA